MSDIETNVGRIYHFRAIHSLPGFPEPWCFPHQHDYSVEVIAVGETPTESLDECWAHLGLGETTELEDLNEWFKPTTVENIAKELLKQFVIHVGPSVIAVTVHEDQARWGMARRERREG